MGKEQLREQIDSLDRQIIELQNEKQRLETELDQTDQKAAAQLPTTNFLKPTNNFSSEEKIGIFRQLFRGRDDVYARFWTSSKTGRKGYSPACKNEWATKVCRKPTLKCSECPNREYSPLDEQVVRRHLSGEMVAGIYPMLKNELCCFLAVDFDKEGWQEEVFAFVEICQSEGVPVAVERSRSGNGAHAWIFFAEEISAAIARQMGCFLITRTMSQKCRLDLKSYDRLFPNQDTLPKGGLGNLIALPLQKEAVRVGNSVFIDSLAKPYPDQWLFLSSIKKLSKNVVSQIADQATRTNQVISARMVPTEENDVPWMQLPSGKKPYKPAIPDLPSQMQVVVADRIYIKMAGVPKILLNQLQQLAAFQNPEFYKRQRLRLSTHITPRVICCAETSGEYLLLPRGCIYDLRALLDEYGITLDIEDKRFLGHKAAFDFLGGLTKEQKMAVKKILENDLGILVAPPGTGKTVLAIAAIEKRKTNTLILVHRKPLLDQWRVQLSAFLGMDIKKVGQIGSGKNKATVILDVAMLQSLERKGKVDDRIANYGFIIVDECHHIGAVSFEQVLTRVKAKYVLGLTATPYRRDGHQPIIYMQCGPVFHQMKRAHREQEVPAHVITRKTDIEYAWSSDSKIYDLWETLVKNEPRNIMIVKDILQAISEGRFPLILTERKEHLEILTKMLEGKVENLAVLHGGIKLKRRKEVLKMIQEANDKSAKAMLATGSYIGEGFDEPRLDTLFITMPVSFKGKIVQYVGRLQREYEGKHSGRIYDYLDPKVTVLAVMYKKRTRTYSNLGFKMLGAISENSSGH